MRSTRVAAAAVAASLLAGVGGAALAQTSTDQGPAGKANWVAAALQGLVDDNTITAQQADAVRQALREARPTDARRPPRHAGPLAHHHGILRTAADVIGIEPRALAQAVRGSSIAQVASQHGSSGEAVVAAALEKLKTGVDERVRAGKLDQERADRILAGAPERLTTLVNRTFPARPGG